MFFLRIVSVFTGFALAILFFLASATLERTLDIGTVDAYAFSGMLVALVLGACVSWGHLVDLAWYSDADSVPEEAEPVE